MRNDLQNILFKKYPLLFSSANLPGFKSRGIAARRDPFSWFGIECRDGWYNIINELCEKLEKYIETLPDKEDYYVTQVKEKFGTLRFYMSSYNDYIHNAISIAEKNSAIVCEVCSSPAKLSIVNGWYRTMCDKCLDTKLRELQ